MNETSLTCLFVSIVLIANMIGAKVITVYGVLLPVGVFIFPLSYFFGSSLAEVYGYSVARRAVWLGALASILFVSFAWLAMLLPAAPTWQAVQNYNTVLKDASFIVFGSLLAFVFSELSNAKILTQLKKRWQGKYFSYRALIAVMIAELLGTLLIIGGGFLHAFSIETVLKMSLHYYLFKILFFILLLPLLQKLIKVLGASKSLQK